MRNRNARVVLTRNALLSVEYPARYVGGEYGAVSALPSDSEDTDAARHDTTLRMALCFPDLYEIGMSNTAIKVLYTLMNQIEGVQCERVFAPAPDFEMMLRGKDLPLFTLESRIPLHECDIVAFSVGYELSATNILNVLELGRVPLRHGDRTEDDPIVIAGGPAMINPVPFGPFLDGVFVGEAEGVLPQLVTELRDTAMDAGVPSQGTATGRKRAAARALLNAHSNVWSEDNPSARRAVWKDFGLTPVKIAFPVPNMKIVQDHATVEIMRGCPQGCRFCSAGVLYRPFRMKPYEVIIEEVAHLVHELGYRSITLSSLSSGDYEGIHSLYSLLNERFAKYGVAFALPSLRVNSITMPLLEQINHVRKSGLTFAVETAGDFGQRAVNKLVPLESTARILEEAERRGWRHAKLYFMLGLPLSQQSANDVAEILDYIDELRSRTRMRYNVAVATFVPKPHTPFQWERQLSEVEALQKIMRLKRGLRDRKMKLGYQAPFQSLLEGLIARGDRSVADIIEEAFRRGARLDAWEEHMDRPLWESVIGEEIAHRVLRERSETETLPWQGVKLGTTMRTLLRERARAREGRLSEQCEPDCKDRCGVCNSEVAARTLSDGVAAGGVAANGMCTQTDNADTPPHSSSDGGNGKTDGSDSSSSSQHFYPVIIRFRKTGTAIYIAHLSVVNTFTRALLRANVPVDYTQGFHPKPKMEFAQPLSTGVYSKDEYCRIWIRNPDRAEGSATHTVHRPIHTDKTPEHPMEAATAKASGNPILDGFMHRLNEALPPGLQVRDAWAHSEGQKSARKPLMSAYWGGEYLIQGAVSDGLTQYLAATPEIVLIHSARPQRSEHASSETTHNRLNNGLIIRIDRSQGRGRGLTKLLQGFLGEHPVRKGLGITRLRSFAQSIESERDPTSYRIRFPETPHSTKPRCAIKT